MTMAPECVACEKLGRCEFTDATKILSHFVCADYKEVSSRAILDARCEVINNFGDAGLKAIVSPNAYLRKEA
jgi:hypothetical protein